MDDLWEFPVSVNNGFRVVSPQKFMVSLSSFWDLGDILGAKWVRKSIKFEIWGGLWDHLGDILGAKWVRKSIKLKV